MDKVVSRSANPPRNIYEHPDVLAHFAQLKEVSKDALNVFMAENYSTCA